MIFAKNNLLPPILAALFAVASLLAEPALGLQDEPTDSNKVKVEQRVKVLVGDDERVEHRVVFVGADDQPIAVDVGFGQRAYLGVGLVDITPELKEHFGVTADGGVLVSQVADDSPAAVAGLRAGDVLTAIDGETMARAGEIGREIGRRNNGETVSLEVWRDGKMLQLGATLEVRERSQVDVGRMLKQGVRLPEMPHLDSGEIPMRVIEIETERLDDALIQLRRQLDSPEWKARIEEMANRRHGLEERIRELEERLREMEKKLAEADG